VSLVSGGYSGGLLVPHGLINVCLAEDGDDELDESSVNGDDVSIASDVEERLMGIDFGASLATPIYPLPSQHSHIQLFREEGLQGDRGPAVRGPW